MTQTPPASSNQDPVATAAGHVEAPGAERTSTSSPTSAGSADTHQGKGITQVSAAGGQSGEAAARATTAAASDRAAATGTVQDNAPAVQAATARGQAASAGQAAGAGSASASAGAASGQGGASAHAGGHDGARDGRGRADGQSVAFAGSGAADLSDGEGASAVAGAASALGSAQGAGASAALDASLPGGPAVDLQGVIDAARATIAMAARQGISQARIALRPQELGEVRIHLSQSADGLLARVTADTPAAAQALAGGRAELQRSLSSLGVSLLRLDIGSSGQSHTQDREGRLPEGAGGSSASGAEASANDEIAQAIGQTAVAGEPAGAPAGLDSGGLVDVLA
jgi:flagellar hook-length control protein FliK